MNLILVALILSVLEFSGWAQTSQGQPRNTVGPQKIPNKGANPKSKDSQQRQRESKQMPTKQRTGTPLIQSVTRHENTLLAGQCLVNGIAMFDGAAWSPQPCTMCICDLGKQVCEPIMCEKSSCPTGQLQTPPGSCCPICVKIEKQKNRNFLPTPKPRKQETVMDEKKENEQKKPDIKLTKHKEQHVKQSRNENRSSTARQVNSVPRRVQRTKKTPETIKPVDVEKKYPASKEESHHEKQETSDQKTGVVLPEKSKRVQNQKKISGAEDQKVVTKEKPAEGKPKSPTVGKETLPSSNGVKKTTEDQIEKNKKPNVADSLPPAPTVQFIIPPIHPTEDNIPSLPSGCLLSESTIACGSTKMKYLPLMTDTGLKTLYLADNEISKLPARAFSGLPNLEWLDLSKNMLGDSGLSVDVFKNLTKLKRLNLDGNRMTVLPLLPISLQELKVNDNNLQELHRYSFRGMSNLLTLELEGNGFHDGNVNPMAFMSLKKLIYLRLDRNHFRAIPSGLPASIQELHLDNNRIEVVPEGILNKTLNLSIIILSNNRLQENHIAPRAWIHLSNLESLDLSYNHLVHVPSFLPRGLKQLILHHNQIELIPGYVFAHMKPGLEFLHLSHNHLRDDGIHAVSFFGLYKSLNELLLDNNLLQSIPRGILSLKGLQVLRLSFNKIRYVPLNSICDIRISEDSNLVSVHLEHNFINRRLIPPTAFSCIKTYHSVVLRPQNGEYEEDYY